MRFKWNDTTSMRPWWEQAFSADDGATWEVNWRNWFTRTAPQASSLPKRADAPHDWDFLVGRWNVQHRRLRERLVGSRAWDDFSGTLVNWPVLGGHGNVGDNVMNMPGGTVRGIGLRALDPKTATDRAGGWMAAIRPSLPRPCAVRFAMARAHSSAMTRSGKAITTRVLWSRITPRSARWEQAAAADGGKTWETNWVSDFTQA